MPNSAVQITPPLATVLLISTAIAWIAPFDVAFAAATIGLPWLQAGLMALMVLIGASFASKVAVMALPVHDSRSRIGRLPPVLTANDRCVSLIQEFGLNRREQAGISRRGS